MTNRKFDPVNAKVSFPEVESAVLSFWNKNKAFAKSLEATKGRNPFVFFDGPPFATGLPHYGHLLAGTLKDIVPRYWTMRGRYVERRFGWDCHGLPVENEVEKAYAISKHNIEDEWGIGVFNEICRSIVLRYTSEWRAVVERMGRWVDFENQYRTMDPPYMESIWWVFSEIWKKGLIYQGFRVQPYCPRCATPLSNFEMNEGYKDVQSPSITVYFPLVNDPSTKLLVWTTTPWTLPSNVACAVGPEISYVKVQDGDSRYIIAKDRIGAYYKDPSQYKVLEELTGKQLQGLRYAPLFDYFAKTSEKFFQVTCADFVSTEDGTGIVHIAPAFGEDDFVVGQKLGLPVVCPVDEEGKFTAEVPDYAGRLVFDADGDIMKRIKAMGRLIHRGTLEHRYPHCYRCDSALIYKAITTWFMKIEPLKKNMLDNNQTIHWVPGHLQNGRFGKGIESAPDWNISRNRYWGTPIPVWLCECGHRECVGSLEQLHKLAGKGDAKAGSELHAEIAAKVQKQVESKWDSINAGKKASGNGQVNFAAIPKDDLHRHIIDEFSLQCPKCKKPMKRTSEVLDCWFESGSMPYAQSHYPFENAKSFDKNFPADFIAEGLDQTRGWFYTLTVLSSALFGKTAFRNVIVNGIILSEDGKKLSKRLKNYAPPEEVLSRLGADALRLFLINSPAVKAEDLRFSENGVLEMSRSVLLPFWNAYSFFVTYANVDGWQPPQKIALSSRNELDRWIVSLLCSVISSVNKEMEEYNLYKVVPLLVDFIDNLTNWYIRRSRRRFWKSENDFDKNAAYTTLYWLLVEFSKVMAPFLPFLTEAIYRNLAGAAASVHCAQYPESNPVLLDEALDEKMLLARSIVTMGRALRSRYNLKIRQPLSELTVIIRNEAKRGLMQDMAALIKDELNVKNVRFDADEGSVVSLSAKANFKRLGKVLGPKMKEAAKIIETFTAADIHGLEKGEKRGVFGHQLVLDDIEVRRTKHEGVEVETEGEITVALNTEITPELCEECLAREFVNRVQTVRKNAGLNVTDRIQIRCACPDQLKSAVNRFRDYVCSETLGSALEWELDKSKASESFEIDEFKGEIQIAVVKGR
ncbi:MAG TPA: isoleucine--tRNA ligase [Chitinivibrionales bacterium]|nr:isoleucine--tRNA ligase [Chitinivibrionales bacterium]